MWITQILWSVEFTEFRGFRAGKIGFASKHPRYMEVYAQSSQKAAEIAVRVFKNSEEPEVLYFEQNFYVRRLYSLWIIPGFKFSFEQIDDPAFYGKLKLNIKTIEIWTK